MYVALLMKTVLEFNVWEEHGLYAARAVDVKKLCMARNCSRNTEETQIRLGKKRAEGYAVHGASSICRKSRYLITNEDIIEVQGPQTSGEVEIVAVMDRGEALVSVGSDHNDRSLETMWTEATGKVYDSAKMKQMVPAVVAKDAWKYEHVKDHWDKLTLRSYVTVLGKRIPYQDFTLGNLVKLDSHFTSHPWLREDGVILFGGTSDTLPTVPLNIYRFQSSIKGLIFPKDFHFEVHDPVLKRTISHSYMILTIEEPESLSL